MIEQRELIEHTLNSIEIITNMAGAILDEAANMLAEMSEQGLIIQ